MRSAKLVVLILMLSLTASACDLALSSPRSHDAGCLTRRLPIVENANDSVLVTDSVEVITDSLGVQHNVILPSYLWATYYRHFLRADTVGYYVGDCAAPLPRQ